MSVLVGVDFQPIDEVATSLIKCGDRYRRLLFSDAELAYCGESASTASKLAGRFAAKEAVLKILDTQSIVPSWRSIEVGSAPGARPEIALLGSAADLAQSQGIGNLSLSLSCAGGVATAVVVATVFSISESSES
jgi:holo-[acyl-carrier protein] synthase